MKVSWIKRKEDNNSFKIPMRLGFDVFSLEEKEEVDPKIEELIAKDYHTIIVSSQIAKESKNISKKYAKDNEIDIIISPGKE